MLGYAAGYKNSTGSNNLFVGAYSNASSSGLTNAGAIGYRSYVTASNSLVLGSINGQNGATASTKVGIGTTAPTYLLQVNGTAAKPGSGSWTVASDERLKQNISEFKDGLAVVSQIKPVWFRYNGKAGMPKEQQYVGILAQAMQKIAPYTVGEFTHQDSTGKTEKYLDYNPNALSYILVNAAKELKAENEAQQQQLVEKDQQIAALETRLARLETMLLKQAPEETTSVARLYQNEPNPYTKTTVIKYFIPHTATLAQLMVYSVTGVEVFRKALLLKGAGKVELSHSAFTSGTYTYHLIVDGQSVDNKKMVVRN
jgi:hypothetical protein